MKRLMTMSCVLFAMICGMLLLGQSGFDSAAAADADKATWKYEEGSEGVAAPEDERYRFAPGDTVEITVLEDPSLNRQALVLPDGRISMPIAGTLMAGGKTPEELAASIRAALKDIFVVPPTVTVSALGLAEGNVEEDIPDAIYVVGEVRNPGAFAFKKQMTVIQALTLAGGPGPFAARTRIIIHRTVDGVATTQEFDYNALEDGGAELGPLLSDGDLIVVPERSLFD